MLKLAYTKRSTIEIDAIHKFMGIGIRSPDENTSNNDQFYGYEENN